LPQAARFLVREKCYMSFVHLHSHTEYSLRDAVNKISEYVARVKELGMNAAAITDHGVMYGTIAFYKECVNAGIKPIIGCEVYVAPKSRLIRDKKDNENNYYHLILLAESNEGYHNLIKIVSQGFIDGFYYKPRVDYEVLEKWHEGIICLSACLAGEVARNITAGRYDKAKEAALRYQSIFGEGNFYLELQDHGISADKNVIQGLMRLHEETHIPLVATNDCHYTRREDAGIHDILLCMQGNHLITDTDRRRYDGEEFYVKSEEEMRTLFPYAPEAIENTQKIADRCNVEIVFHDEKLPHFKVPEGYDSWTYLNKLCDDGLARRYGDKAPEIKPKLDYELGVIREMGFVDYFLIVWDFINFARTHGIAVGPGRGSAAGSLVSYTTGITDIDPERFGLFFERFLNKERMSMPDIDVDIEYVRREDVISYVVEKYGRDCVTQIVTFGTLAARNAIRAVGRVLGLPYAKVDSVAKAVPSQPHMTIAKAMKQNPDLQKMYDEDDVVQDLIDKAKSLEGLPANSSTHASGVIIGEKPMTEFVPVSRNETDGPLVTQYTMTEDEELGLLKMDFLGLRTLTVIKDAALAANEQLDAGIDMEKLTYDDQAVFDEMGSGHTEGIFQLESGGMEAFMKDLHPQSLEEVTAGISLYRPGPMQFIPDYIKGKENKSSISYDCPELRHILEPTYGCIVYQEQVMQIVRDLAGYSLGGADNVRRAMAKKKMKVMEEERKNFVYGREDPDPAKCIPGCIKNGINEDVANRIFDKMIEFANYAFNKSHAACYAVVAYQTAYLKHYYPAQFMASLLTSFVDSTVKVTGYISVCRSMGIEVLPPDINMGEGCFSVQDNKIRFGMYAIKSVGEGAVDSIIEERKKNGPFTTLYGFLKRMSEKETVINKRAVENLIKAGALDCLDGNRREMLNAASPMADRIVNGRKTEEKNNIPGQLSFFDMADDSKNSAGADEELPDRGGMKKLQEFDKSDLLENEKEVLGIYLSGHPLEDYMELIKENTDAKASDFMEDPDTGFAGVRDGSHVTLGGMVTNVKIISTKKGQLMAVVNIEDLSGNMEVTVFPSVFEKNRRLLEKDKKIFVYGRVSTKEDEDASLLAEEMVGFDEVPEQMFIRFDDMASYEKEKDFLSGLTQYELGADRIIIYLSSEHQMKAFHGVYCFRKQKPLVEEVNEHFGRDNVQIIEKHIEFGRKRY